MAHGGTRVSAEQAMFRLLRSIALTDKIWQLIAKYNPLSANDIVNVDYSTFNMLSILGFAKQTKHGRAMPVLMEAGAANTGGQKKTDGKYQYLKELYAKWKTEVDTDQYGFVIQGLNRIHSLYGVKPRLVYDRGFVNKRMLTFMENNGWTFYVRMRESYIVTVDERIDRQIDRQIDKQIDKQKHQVSSLPQGDYRVTWSGMKLRLVIGSTSRRHKTPWCILTNDFKTDSRKIIKIYYHRFEIEECFRDIKSLFRLRSACVRTWRSLNTILVFMSIALICALASVKQDVLLGAMDNRRSDRSGRLCKRRCKYEYECEREHKYKRRVYIHNKKRISAVRQWQETIGRETWRAIF
jgi:hypothetical protein